MNTEHPGGHSDGAARPGGISASPRAFSSYIISPVTISDAAQCVPLEMVTVAESVIIPGGTLYEFGILSSYVHAAWMKAAKQRAEQKHREASTEMVYNTLPWPDATEEQRAAIEDSAREILEVRARFSGTPLAELYRTDKMPAELREAHQKSDRAVMAAYGINPDTADETVIARHLGMLHGARMQAAHAAQGR